MNIVEAKRIIECRERLESLKPECPVQIRELQRVKDILEDMVEFKIFPSCPGFTV